MQTSNRRQGWIARAARGLAGLVCLSLALAVPHPAGAEALVYYHVDRLGSVRAVTSSTGEVVEQHDYYAYGEECTTGVCTANVGVGSGQSLHFTGKERDRETGLDYFGARYYGSRIGRFTTVDPFLNTQANLVEPQRWNRYAYVTNNPLRFTDPDGRDRVAEFFLGEAGKNINTWEALTGTEAQAHYAQTAAEHPVIAGQLAVASLLAPDPTDAALAPIAARAFRLFGKADDVATEVVQRAMSRAEVEATQATGLIRGGREGTHYVSDAVNSGAQRARQRLSLGQTPEVRVTMEVPKGKFSPPSKVAPKNGMPGGGMERTATGQVPAKVIRVDEMKR